MIPVVKNLQYRIALDPNTDIAYLLYDTNYQGNIETPVIQLPPNPWRCYTEHGHLKFLDWVKRINEDYQVGRFSKENPRLYTDYQFASAEEIETIDHCFDKNITLIEIEALRLLSLCNHFNLAFATTEMLKQGRTLSIEIFCKVFLFFQSPLLPANEASTLVEKSRHENPYYTLDKNPLKGCPDAAAVALVFLAKVNNIRNIFCGLSFFRALNDEHGFRFLRERINYYLTEASKLSSGEFDESCLKHLVVQLKQEFPSSIPDSTKNNCFLPYWISMEQSLTWEHDCIECLGLCFTEFDVSFDYDDLRNLLHLPSGADYGWNRYSVSQAIKYCNQDPEFFTKITVAKPRIPIDGYEKLVVSVWRHYLAFFRPDLNISDEVLETVLDNFIRMWNGETLDD